MKPLFKITTCVIAFLAASSIVSNTFAQSTELTFANGDTLNGDIIKITPTELHFKHPAFSGSNNTAILEIDKINSLRGLKDSSEKSLKKQALGQLTMVPRLNKNLKNDIYQGTIKTINETHVILDTPYGGQLNIDKKFIKKLDIYNNNEFIIPSLGQLTDWKLIPSNALIRQKNQKFHFPRPAQGSRSTGNRTIIKQVDLPESFHTNLKIERLGSRSYNSFYLSLFSDKNAQSYSKESSILISLNYTKLQIKQEGAKNRQVIASKNLDDNILRKTPKLEFDIYVNVSKKKKTISVYLNGDPVIQDAEMKDLDTSKLGKHVYFKYLSSYATLDIADFTIRKWNGSKPRIPEKSRIKLEEKGEYIRLQNGDTMIGKIKKIKDSIAYIETQFGLFKVKLENISSLDIGTKEDQEIKMNEGDARLTFYNGSKFIVQIKDIKDNKIIGSSQAFPELKTFDIKHIKSIEFQKSIYPE